MNTFKRIFIFIGANLLGFFSVGICYGVGITSGKVSLDNENFDAALFEKWFLGGTMMIWAACAIFSLSYFILDEKTRNYFLAMPAIFPFIYGLSVIFFVI